MGNLTKAACAGTHLARCLPYPHELHQPVLRSRDTDCDFSLTIYSGAAVSPTGCYIESDEQEYICNSALEPQQGDYVYIKAGTREELAIFHGGDCRTCPKREPATCDRSIIVGVLIERTGGSHE